MNNQEVFEMLANLEEFFFYKRLNEEELEKQIIFQDMQETTGKLLLKWHNLTGCKNPT